MTTPSKPDLVALAPCPFCGSKFLMGREPHDNAPVGGMFYLYHDYGPLGSPARKCPISVNGHFQTEIEAIAAWNTRHLASQPSSYEDGREALISVRNWLDTQFNEKPSSADLHRQISKLNAAIASLPADGDANDIQSSDGGVESRHAERPITARAKHTGGSGESRLQSPAGVAPGPSEATPSTAGSVRDWVVRKGGYFYRPNSAGYTASIHEAGRYTESDAIAESVAAAGVTAHPASEFMTVSCTSHAGSVREALEPGAILGLSPSLDRDLAERQIPRTFQDELQALRAALSAPVEAPVAVKPLEWDSIDGTCMWANVREFSQSYRISLRADGMKSLQLEWLGNRNDGLGQFVSWDAAKAAAQADFEWRIRSALIATPRPLPSVDGHTCQARRQSLPEPADCNWPDCGCDPHATKVIESLVEQGWRAPPPPLAWDAYANRGYEPVEARAKEIYDGFVYDGPGKKPVWVPGGNGDKQDEARVIARKELRLTLLGGSAHGR